MHINIINSSYDCEFPKNYFTLNLFSKLETFSFQFWIIVFRSSIFKAFPLYYFYFSPNNYPCFCNSSKHYFILSVRKTEQIKSLCILNSYNIFDSSFSSNYPDYYYYIFCNNMLINITIYILISIYL